MKIFLITLSFFLTALQSISAESQNLLRFKKSYVLETKRIVIPGFPDAFNPCIVSWQGKILMCFRSYDPETASTDGIFFVWLDKDFNLTSEPTALKRIGEVAVDPSRAQDPRLIVVNEHLYLVYSNTYPEPINTSRMIVGEIEEDADNGFRISFPSNLLQYQGQIQSRKEKNWVPFVYENQLFLAYSLQPHRILMPILETTSCIPICSTIGTIEWKWGYLFGGTPALRVGDSYLSFFHSNKVMSTVHSNDRMMNHYFMGAYTFDAKYPFAINAISPQPIVAKTFYEGEMYEGKTWKPLRVVFPAGIVVDDNFVWVSYGRQDHETWVIKLDKAGLLKSLTPVTMIKESRP